MEDLLIVEKTKICPTCKATAAAAFQLTPCADLTSARASSVGVFAAFLGGKSARIRRSLLSVTRYPPTCVATAAAALDRDTAAGTF